ncbi:MAG: DUF934 domain-containing protein [Candidatus Binatia bacterium]|nr:DUF934 domain-containing protein [Candidatus Binatia bacterium]
MQIIRNRKIVDDDWTTVADDTAVPANGNVFVSVERWRSDRDALLARSGKLGVTLPNTIDPRELEGDLTNFSAIAVHFPIYRDGRAFSIARLLRERLEYKDEIRAVGNVLRDQILFMERCGFDTYEVAEGKSVESALEGFGDFSVTYQDAIDTRTVPRTR